MAWDVLKPTWISVHLCIHLLKKMVASYKDLQYGRFHTRLFQLDLLDRITSSHAPEDPPVAKSQDLPSVVATDCSTHRGSEVRNSELDSANHSCKPQMLGSSHSRGAVSRKMVQSGSRPSNQHSGKQGHKQCPSAGLTSSSRSGHSGPVGQCDGSNVHKPTGQNKRQSCNVRGVKNSPLGREKCCGVVSCLHSGSRQVGSRLPQQRQLAPGGVGPSTGGVQILEQLMWISTDRHDGLLSQQEAQVVLFQVERPTVGGGRCPDDSMGLSDGVHVSSTSSDPKNSKENKKGKDSSNSNCSRLDK
ncbi:uncharacterized protein LOC134956812 [Pseudophryne corroboree]|uniref:uncharacterized protein LOC134956812 n=1 Tax=Pseudophryne corroboree TaxID=495146 RepID=UPI003081D45C